MLSEGGGGWRFPIYNLFRRFYNACTFPSADAARSAYKKIDSVMDNSAIVASVELNAVPYPYLPRVVPTLSDNSFSYS